MLNETRHQRLAGDTLLGARGRGWGLMLSRPVTIALCYLGALAAAEVVTAVVNPPIGLVLHALILMAALFHGARTEVEALRALLLALSLAPLIRILSLSLPLAGIPVRYWYAIVGLPVCAATFVIARTLEYSRRDLGLVVHLHSLPFDLAMLPLGLGIGAIEYLILQPQALARGLTVAEIWLPAFILTVSTGFEEELVFRGLLQRAALQSLGLTGGLLYVSALFAVLHTGYLSPADLVFVFLAGLLFALVTLRTGSILGATLAHASANVGLFLVWPFVLPSILARL